MGPDALPFKKVCYLCRQNCITCDFQRGLLRCKDIDKESQKFSVSRQNATIRKTCKQKAASSHLGGVGIGGFYKASRSSILGEFVLSLVHRASLQQFCDKHITIKL